MNKLYMGIDIGSVSTKGVVIDEYNNIITSSYVHTEDSPVKAVKKVINDMRKDIDLEKYKVVSVGTTGSARKLIGTMLGAVVIKNDIMAEAVGTINIYPDVRTILEIGGHDSKIMLVKNKIVTDYAINTLCYTGTGVFLESLAKRLKVNINDFEELILNSKKKLDITTKCMIFLEADLIQKMHEGYKKEDIVAGAVMTIAKNYMNNVLQGKKIQSPMVMNGGVSLNGVVVKALRNLLGEEIIVNKNAHLMGALGVAIMAKESKKESIFDFNIDNYNIETKIVNCGGCQNNCEIVNVYKNDKLIDYWGNKCQEVKNV